MKSIILTVALVTLPLIASAQTWIEQRTDIQAEQTIPRLDGWISGKIAGSVGTFVWFQVDKSYAEAYIGPSFSPKPWLQFGLGAGVELADRPLRIATFAWTGNSRVSLLFIGEGLGSGFWYKAEFNWAPTKNLGVGLMTERFKGTGPRVQFLVPHSPITIWTAVLVQKEDNRALVGVRVKM